MRTKLLSFLLVMACAALIGLHPLRAQDPTGSSDANGNAVTAPAKQSDASHTAVSPSSAPKSDQALNDSKREADNAIANDRGTVTTSAGRRPVNLGLLALVAVFGLIVLVVFIRRRNLRAARNPKEARDAGHNDYRRAA